MLTFCVSGKYTKDLPKPLKYPLIILVALSLRGTMFILIHSDLGKIKIFQNSIQLGRNDFYLDKMLLSGHML